MKNHNLHVKYFLFFFFLSGVFLAAIGSDNKSNIQIHLDSDSLFIQNGSISLKISDHLKLSPALLDKGRNLSFVSNIPHDMPTFYVRAEGEVINRFKVDWDTFREESINDGIGQGRRIEITAYANQNVSSLAEPVNLEMTLNLYLYEKFPFSVITQFKINNLGGQIIQIDKIVSNDYHLDRRLLDPAKPSWEFVSYQGTSLHWGKDYAMIRTTPDMKRENFLGITLIENGRSTGGGTPIIDIWAPQCGLALASVEPKPQWISMPMSGNHEGLIEIAIVEDLKNNPGKKNLLKPGESLSSIRTGNHFFY